MPTRIPVLVDAAGTVALIGAGGALMTGRPDGELSPTLAVSAVAIVGGLVLDGIYGLAIARCRERRYGDLPEGAPAFFEVPRCESDGDCDRGTTCERGRCLPLAEGSSGAACSFYRPCTGGLVCQAGVCAPPSP